MMRFTHPEQERPFRTPAMNFVAPAGIVLCLAMMLSLPAITWLRLLGWLAFGLIIYFLYGMKHSTLGKELRMEIATHGASPAGSPK
jgi:basic amino acid/polyamine antiporter, APA family